MRIKLYCFSLYCESGCETKSQAFVSMQSTEEKARQSADNYNKKMFPPSEGWKNHNTSMVIIPHSVIMTLAQQSENDK